MIEKVKEILSKGINIKPDQITEFKNVDIIIDFDLFQNGWFY